MEKPYGGMKKVLEIEARGFPRSAHLPESHIRCFANEHLLWTTIIALQSVRTSGELTQCHQEARGAKVQKFGSSVAFGSSAERTKFSRFGLFALGKSHGSAIDSTLRLCSSDWLLADSLVATSSH